MIRCGAALAALAASLAAGAGPACALSFDTEAQCRAWIAERPQYISCMPILLHAGPPMDQALKAAEHGDFERNPDGSLRWQPMVDPESAMPPAPGK
jgi:hypothetical protein